MPEDGKKYGSSPGNDPQPLLYGLSAVDVRVSGIGAHIVVSVMAPVMAPLYSVE